MKRLSQGMLQLKHPELALSMPLHEYARVDRRQARRVYVLVLVVAKRNVAELVQRRIQHKGAVLAKHAAYLAIFQLATGLGHFFHERTRPGNLDRSSATHSNCLQIL